MLVIPKILEYSEAPSGNIVYGVGLCLALFFTECIKSLGLCSCWVLNQRTAIRFRSAVASFAFEKLMQFKSLTHVTTGEVSAWDYIEGHTCLAFFQTSLPWGPREGGNGVRKERK